ncbi:MAG TPA: DUF72 domain-containing protein [Candidatus Binatia bacterium]|nr:DUF72 domain-containing protein [Candidatus Binatia bacterium]
MEPGAAGRVGRLLVGTSGYAYADWAPRFYPPGTRSADLLRSYAERLPACELNNTFYQQPKSDRIRAWLAATPQDFRFVVKAQRGGSMAALAADPVGTLAWLLRPYREFGERLGSVLFRIPANVRRDDTRLAGLLAAWPADVPLTVEAQDPSWAVDETFDALRRAGAAWCATDLDEGDEPPIRLIAPWLYLRLRRTSYDDAALDTWADRLEPFLAAGQDAFVFFRHDADGKSAVNAVKLADRIRARLGAPAATGMEAARTS